MPSYTTSTPYKDCYFETSDSLKLYYRDYDTAPKNAPVVLCMPGLTRNSKDFAGIATHLSKTCRVICAEQRGRGNSQWDPTPANYKPNVYVADMITLLSSLNITHIIALGTSLGGIMTMLMATMHPGLIKAAVINDIGPVLDPAGIKRISSYVGKGLPPKTWEEAIEATKSANKNVYPAFTEDEWRSITENVYKDISGVPTLQYDPAIGQSFEQSPDQTSPNLWPFFEALKTVPLVVLRGAISDLLSAETLDQMAASHPDLTPVVVEDKGHVPLMTEPECIKAIDALVKKVSN